MSGQTAPRRAKSSASATQPPSQPDIHPEAEGIPPPASFASVLAALLLRPAGRQSDSNPHGGEVTSYHHQPAGDCEGAYPPYSPPCFQLRHLPRLRPWRATNSPGHRTSLSLNNKKLGTLARVKCPGFYVFSFMAFMISKTAFFCRGVRFAH